MVAVYYMCLEDMHFEADCTNIPRAVLGLCSDGYLLVLVQTLRAAYQGYIAKADGFSRCELEQTCAVVRL